MQRGSSTSPAWPASGRPTSCRPWPSLPGRGRGAGDRGRRQTQHHLRLLTSRAQHGRLALDLVGRRARGQRAEIWLDAGRRVQRSPAVKYRPASSSTTRRLASRAGQPKFGGGMNAGFYKGLRAAAAPARQTTCGRRCGTTPLWRRPAERHCWPTNTASSWAPRTTSP